MCALLLPCNVRPEGQNSVNNVLKSGIRTVAKQSAHASKQLHNSMQIYALMHVRLHSLHRADNAAQSLCIPYTANTASPPALRMGTRAYSDREVCPLPAVFLVIFRISSRPASLACSCMMVGGSSEASPDKSIQRFICLATTSAHH